MAARLSTRLSGIRGLARFSINRSSTVGRARKPRCFVAISPNRAMRYAQVEMTETTGYHFTHLAPAAAGLGQIFARPKAIAAGCVIVLAGLGWFYLALLIAAPSRARGSPLVQALCRHASGRSLERLRRCRHRIDVGRDDVGNDAAERLPHDPDLCGDRRHRRAQERAHRLAVRARGWIHKRCGSAFRSLRRWCRLR